MSIESAKLFSERMKKDEEFAKKVIACKDIEDRNALIQKAGFDFTASEFREAGMILSDDELDDIVGSGSQTFNPPINISFG
jgi:predicted ribosomally synthesized peptide with nif11-like leader